ncbi:MAG: VWA domain-containing protein [Verrucomicrobiota bacterium]
MNKLFFALSLAGGLAFNLHAGETLRLKLEPEQEFILSGSPQEVVVKIDLAATRLKGDHRRRTPLNLAIVLDKSGSMSGAKIEKTRQAAMQLVDRLGPDDFISVVTYSDSVEVLFPAQKVDGAERLKSCISQIQAGGSTALYAGVQAGAEELEKHFSAKRINRVILLSDGLANVGPKSPAELRRLGRQLSERGIAVTTVGVGDDYNEDLMAGLAEASDANYYYVQDTEKLSEIFAKELGELITVAAREIRIEIICPNGVKPIGLIGRPEKFEGQTAVVKLSQFASGQQRYLFLKCQVEREKSEIAQVNISYVDDLNGGRRESVSQNATVRYTKDSKVAAKSMRQEIAAQKELVVTAVAKDEALAFCDAKNFKAAQERLSQQTLALQECAKTAPASAQTQLKQEIQNLQERQNQIGNGQYDKSFRKSLQSESYNTRNSK